MLSAVEASQTFRHAQGDNEKAKQQNNEKVFFKKSPLLQQMFGNLFLNLREEYFLTTIYSL